MRYVEGARPKHNAAAAAGGKVDELAARRHDIVGNTSLDAGDRETRLPAERMVNFPKASVLFSKQLYQECGGDDGVVAKLRHAGMSAPAPNADARSEYPLVSGHRSERGRFSNHHPIDRRML